MNIETKYSPGDNVYVIIVVGQKQDPKVLPSVIQSIDILAAVSGTTVKYNCRINRLDAGTVIQGMPMFYTVERSDDRIYLTEEDAFNSMVVKKDK